MSKEAQIYVVGFPKSGNTWLLRILCDLCDANIDQGGVVNRADYRANRQKTIIKMHFEDPNSVILGGKVIYIVRDVRDVLVSGFFHTHRALQRYEASFQINAANNLFNRFGRVFFRHQIRRLNDQWNGNQFAAFQLQCRRALQNAARLLTGRPLLSQQRLNWSEHVLFWSRRPDVHVVRYEDLLNQGVDTVARILDYLEYTQPQQHIAEVLEKQAFNARKNQFKFEQNTANDRFLRNGKDGDWRRFLLQSIESQIIERHRNAMIAMGYLEGNHTNNEEQT
jgi:hypothetical protein